MNEMEKSLKRSLKGLKYLRDDKGAYLVNDAGEKEPFPSMVSQKQLMEVDFTYVPKYCKVNMKNLTIKVTGSSYEIDMEKWTSAAKLLDSLYQLSHKSFMTTYIFWDLINTVDQVCKDVFDRDVQGVFCPFGRETKVNWKKKSIT